jgi:hypothetical protein
MKTMYASSFTFSRRIEARPTIDPDAGSGIFHCTVPARDLRTDLWKTLSIRAELEPHVSRSSGSVKARARLSSTEQSNETAPSFHMHGECQ